MIIMDVQFDASPDIPHAANSYHPFITYSQGLFDPLVHLPGHLTLTSTQL